MAICTIHMLYHVTMTDLYKLACESGYGGRLLKLFLKHDYLSFACVLLFYSGTGNMIELNGNLFATNRNCSHKPNLMKNWTIISITR